MEKVLQNKVVAVTGGAGGIGSEIADKYLQNGAKSVILLDINETQGTETARVLSEKYGDGKVTYIKCDVTKDLEEVWENILSTQTTIDVLVLSAGIKDRSNVKKIININLTAVIEWTLKFEETMRKDKGGNGGTVIAISSILGFRTLPYGAEYHATKSGVNAFTKSLGHKDNFEKTGVRVISICPGFTETQLTLQFLDSKPVIGYPDDFVQFVRSFPWQKVEDVGNAAVEVYKRGASGSLWLIEGGNPIEEIR